MGKPPNTKAAMAAYSLALLAVNTILIWPLFGVEFSAYTGSIEGTFIAIARLMAKYPGERDWWPFWNGGIPFELSYLPFTHWLAAGLTAVTGLSAARCYHLVAAAGYGVGPVTVFWLAVVLSGRVLTSFVAGLGVSCLSLTTLLVPAAAADAGGMLHLRRLRDLIAYGESPHIFALTLLPLAVLAFDRALRMKSGAWSVAAGCAAAAVVLSNAFGAMALVASVVCLLAIEGRGFRQATFIGVAAFCGVLPWVSPAFIRAIQANAATTGGDYRYAPATWAAAVLLLLGFAGVCVVTRALPRTLRVFVLLAYFPSGAVGCWYIFRIAVVPQPHRLELEMDIALLLAAVFAGSAVLDRFGPRIRVAATCVVLAALAAQTVHMWLHARSIIRDTDPSRLSEYKIARWLETNRPGERTFVPGSVSLLLNAFSDVPQLHGGHDQHTRNTFIPIASFTIYSGMNAGERDAEISVFWLKVFGVRTVAVTGPQSTEVYKPFANPRKFDGALPLLWREGDDAIYEIPSRSRSLAHVIPREAVVGRRPIHGLDIAPVQPYVAALDDPGLPLASMTWKNLHEAVIRAPMEAGRVISVQVTYDAGWVAVADGRAQPIRSDAIGQIVIEPACTGPCEILLTYTGS